MLELGAKRRSLDLTPTALRAIDSSAIAIANKSGESGHPCCVPQKRGKGSEQWVLHEEKNKFIHAELCRVTPEMGHLRSGAKARQTRLQSSTTTTITLALPPSSLFRSPATDTISGHQTPTGRP
ncbi:unnamed protein product [Lota lota]